MRAGSHLSAQIKAKFCLWKSTLHGRNIKSYEQEVHKARKCDIQATNTRTRTKTIQELDNLTTFALVYMENKEITGLLTHP